MSDERLASTANDTRRQTFTPHSNPFRTERRVHDTHAPNYILYQTLDKGLPDCKVGLMASHGPGEKDHRPTYYVRVESRNDGIGHPMIPTVVRELVDSGDVKLLKVLECSDDHLAVSIRAVSEKVVPNEVRFDEVPDR